VGGLKFAFELVSNNPQAQVTQRIIVDKIELDPEIDDSRFEKPTAPSSTDPSAPTPQAAQPSFGHEVSASLCDAKNADGINQRPSTSLR
jgi:hypothetical protein